jgi:pimeloyl-ACP methyl ester carboxylesterase
MFDDFAPKLTAEHHVYGITRRGFGASGFSATNYGADRLGEDVLEVIDSLKLETPVLVGHSLAGEELSSIGNRYPKRVAALIYLEAAYPYAFDNGKGPTMQQIQELQGPQPPPPGEADMASFAALYKYFVRVNGFPFPEAELRQRWEATPDGRVGKHRDFPGYATILNGMKKYTDVPVSALVIFANPHSQGAWVDNNKDPAIQKAAGAYTAGLNALIARQEQVVEQCAPTARLITIPGAHHYIYLSNQAEVLRDMNAFLGKLSQ